MSNIDNTAFFKISYGLYAVTVNDGVKDNALIVNTVTQVASNPLTVSVSVSKANYSCGVIQNTKKMNVNCLTVKAPFSLFEQLGFKSGREVDKLKNIPVIRSENGLAVLTEFVNAFLSLTVIQEIDLGSHILFVCSVDEARVLNDDESVTYTYYHKSIKPKPSAQPQATKGYICRICGYIYEGDVLPEDFVCPLCKHGAEDFEPIE